jgi:hypothetical protein
MALGGACLLALLVWRLWDDEGVSVIPYRISIAAQCLPRGRAVGVDVWSTTDQSGNAEQVTRQNAALEGVAERVELHTADMRQLPFDDGSFDVVLSAHLGSGSLTVGSALARCRFSSPSSISGARLVGDN